MEDNKISQEVRSSMERRMYQLSISLSQRLRDLNDLLDKSDYMQVWVTASVLKEEIDKLVRIYDVLNGLEGE